MKEADAIEKMYAAAGDTMSFIKAYDEVDLILPNLRKKYDAKLECLRRNCEAVCGGDVREERVQRCHCKETLEQSANRCLLQTSS